MVVINDCAPVHSNTRIDKFISIPSNKQNSNILETNISWPALRTMKGRRVSVIDRAFGQYGPGLINISWIDQL